MDNSKCFKADNKKQNMLTNFLGSDSGPTSNKDIKGCEMSKSQAKENQREKGRGLKESGAEACGLEKPKL